MNRQAAARLEEQEAEDRRLEAGPWQDLLRRDYANGEELIASTEKLLQERASRPHNIPLFYRIMRQRKEVLSVGAPVRTGREFSLRKHATCFVAYYHSHDFYEMLYVYRGKLIQYELESRIPAAFAQGSVCLMAPGMVHAMAPATEQDIIFKIVIPAALFERVGVSCPGTMQELSLLLEQGMVKLHDTGAHFNSLMEMLAEEQLGEEAPREEVIGAYLALIFSEIVRLAKEPARVSRLLVEIEAYLQDRDAGVLLEEMAADMGYSADYLGRRIRKESGESFTRLRQRFFLEKAAELLVERDLPVDDIAAKLGYRSTSSFYQLFQREYGISPGSYRRLMGS